MSRGGANRNGRGRDVSRPRQPPLAPFSDLELAHLLRLVFEAFVLREGGCHDAVAAIEDWYWRTLPDRAERAAHLREEGQ